MELSNLNFLKLREITSAMQDSIHRAIILRVKILEITDCHMPQSILIRTPRAVLLLDHLNPHTLLLYLGTIMKKSSVHVSHREPITPSYLGPVNLFLH